MTRPSRRAGWVSFVFAAAALTALFFLSCEKRSIDVPRGFQGEAARNPYLAAQRMLERMGTPVRSSFDLSGLDELPPADATLIVPTARRTLSKSLAERLVGWVESGGHLVVVTWQLYDDEARTPDLVLDPLGVRQFLNAADDEDAAPPETEPEAPSETPPLVTQASASDEDEAEPAPELAEAIFAERAQPLRVEFDPGFRIELDPAAEPTRVFEIADSNGVHWVTLRVGEGLVTALTDDYFLTQPLIGDWDHAELVYRMSHFDGRNGPVWIIHGDEYPGALALVARHAWMIATSALLVVALWVWSVSRRHGPIASDPSSDRRELMEHVRASGRFQWRRGAGSALLAAERDALLERVRERHPSLAGLVPAEQAARLAELSGIPRESVLRALSFGADTESGRFAQNIATLEKIRRSL